MSVDMTALLGKAHEFMEQAHAEGVSVSIRLHDDEESDERTHFTMRSNWYAQRADQGLPDDPDEDEL